MAHIKSYTDIEQSRELAKILPLESADMYWDLLSKDNYAKVNNIGNCLGRTCVCAWSLATLLDVIPCGQVNKMADSNKYAASSWNDYDFEPQMYVEGLDNPVDACYDLILKLNEQNLI